MQLLNLRSRCELVSYFLWFQKEYIPLHLPVFLCIGTRETWFKFLPGVSKQWNPQPYFPHLQGPSPFYNEDCVGEWGREGKGSEPQRMAWLPQPSTCKPTSPVFSQKHFKLPAATPCLSHSLLPLLFWGFSPVHLARSTETVETVSDFMFLGSKITADGDCRHEIKKKLTPWKESYDQPR